MDLGILGIQIHLLRRLRRTLERKWLKSKNEIDRVAYVKQKNIVNIAIHKAKCTYYNDQLLDADSKSMLLYILC